MLGSDTVFKKYVGTSATLDETDRTLLAKVLRPFILRRTKQQVVEDLPEKTEQTLYCDMEAEQARCYDELRTHYRDALLCKDTARVEPIQDRSPRSSVTTASGCVPSGLD